MVKFMKVAVVMGGCSSEREVSLRSGANIVTALREAGCEVTEVVLDSESVECLRGFDGAVYIALHGGYGENGGIQADLEKLGLPYTGSGPEASRIAMDKVLSKRIFDKAGIPNAPYEVLGPGENTTKLNFPVVVKPPRDGSSVGLTCPCREDEFAAALARAREVDPEVLVEEFIPGLEWTVAVIAGESLPVIQIEPKSGVYDYEAKYTAGATVETALDDTDATLKCRALAVEACKAIGVRGLARVDFRVTPEGKFYVLEINTLPGFTATSLVPQAAAKAGMSRCELCARVLNMASCGE